MTKTYKHNKLWRIASNEWIKWYIKYWISNHNTDVNYLPKELIENSNDRVLQEEKDWIEDCATAIWQLYLNWATPERDTIIDVIDWYVPKQEKTDTK